MNIKKLQFVFLVIMFLPGCYTPSEQPSPETPNPLLYPADRARYESSNRPDLTMPAFGESVMDPITGNRITRITDGPDICWTGGFPKHDYSKAQPWNADQSMYRYSSVAIYDATSYQPIRCLPNLYVAKWSHLDPNIIYSFKPNQRRILRYNTETEVTEEIVDLSNECDYMALGPGEGNIDIHDKRVALACRVDTADSEKSDLRIVMVDLQSGEVTASKTMQGAWHGRGDRPGVFDWVSVSQQGDYVVINWSSHLNQGNPYMENGQQHYGVEVYDTDTLTFQRRLWHYGNHGDLCVDSAGDEAYVQFNGSSGSQVNMYRLHDGQHTVLISEEQNPNGDIGTDFLGHEGHISCRNTRRPGWAYVSLEYRSGISTPESINDGEILAVKLDGSGTVEHFGHHQSSATSYAKSVMPVPSPDGSKVMFSSDWGNSQNPELAYEFVVDVPPLGIENLVTNEEIKNILDQIISIFENNTPVLQYDYAENHADGRGITAGRAGFTSATSDMLEVIERYTIIVPDNLLAEYLPRLRELAADEDGSTQGLEGLGVKWQQSANDVSFRNVQDEVSDEYYYIPAIAHAERLGAIYPLTLLNLYDAAIQHGDGDDPDGLSAMISRTTASVGGTPATGISEEVWLVEFMSVRRSVLLHPDNQVTQQVWSESVGRVDTMIELYQSGNLLLTPPIEINPWGTAFTIMTGTYPPENPSPEQPSIAPVIGAGTIAATPLEQGTIFVSPDGSGNLCTRQTACNIITALNTVQAGDVVFLRGGIYYLTKDKVQHIFLKGGTVNAPVIYESYPGEQAIFDGSTLSPFVADENRKGTIFLAENYTILRNLEIRNMPLTGVRISGNHNTIEGCHIHGNHRIGIYVHNGVNGYSAGDDGGSYNNISNNIVNDNSDAGMSHGPYDDGNIGDGIAIDSGVGNLISHNTVYENSDDGIDTWKSINTIVEYNLVYGHGKGTKGGGNGFKLGGDHDANSPLARGVVARHNISYNNKTNGFSYNAGKEVLMEYNTAYENGLRGFATGDDTIVSNNIASRNRQEPSLYGSQTNNSWDRAGQVVFINSTNPELIDFLRPVTGDVFEDIGAYAALD